MSKMVRALTPDGDIVTSGQHFLRDKFAVGQIIETRLRLFLGEYFLDVSEGSDWFAKVLNRQGSLAQTDALVQQRIIRTDKVIGLQRFESESDISQRSYTLSADVLTEYGVVEIETGGFTGG